MRSVRLPFRKFAAGLLAAAGVLWAWASPAHDPGLSSATVTLTSNALQATLVFSVVDAGQIVEMDEDGDGKFSKDELEAGRTALEKGAPKALEVKFDGQPVSSTTVHCALDHESNATVTVSFPATSFTNLTIRSKWLALLPIGHRQYFTLLDPEGKVLAQRLLSANSDLITIQQDAAAPASRPTEVTTFIEFLGMGVKHIWTGYDHLLFLFGLLVVTKRFSSAVKIITSFTIAHSITLAVATLSLVSIPSRIVEPMIAASIVYVGVENLWRRDDPKGRWMLAFAFGLIHGFGFASVLKELGVGDNGRSIVVPLVSFNLGVELGQVVIAALALPLIWKLRDRPGFVDRWVPACSVIVAILGAYWFVQRVWF